MSCGEPFTDEVAAEVLEPPTPKLWDSQTRVDAQRIESMHTQWQAGKPERTRDLSDPGGVPRMKQEAALERWRDSVTHGDGDVTVTESWACAVSEEHTSELQSQ